MTQSHVLALLLVAVACSACCYAVWRLFGHYWHELIDERKAAKRCDEDS